MYAYDSEHIPTFNCKLVFLLLNCCAINYTIVIKIMLTVEKRITHAMQMTCLLCLYVFDYFSCCKLPFGCFLGKLTSSTAGSVNELTSTDDENAARAITIVTT